MGVGGRKGTHGREGRVCSRVGASERRQAYSTGPEWRGTRRAWPLGPLKPSLTIASPLPPRPSPPSPFPPSPVPNRRPRTEKDYNRRHKQRHVHSRRAQHGEPMLRGPSGVPDWGRWVAGGRHGGGAAGARARLGRWGRVRRPALPLAAVSGQSGSAHVRVQAGELGQPWRARQCGLHGQAQSHTPATRATPPPPRPQAIPPPPPQDSPAQGLPGPPVMADGKKPNILIIWGDDIGAR